MDLTVFIHPLNTYKTKPNLRYNCEVQVEESYTPLNVLEWIEKWTSRIDESSNLLLSTISISTLHKILNLFLNEKYREMLQFIVEHQAFTSLSIQKKLKYSKGEVNYLISLLDGYGMIKQAGFLSSKAGPKTRVYLVVGADEQKLKDAVMTYNDIENNKERRFLDVVEYEDVINDIVECFKEDHNKQYGHSSGEVIKLIRKRLGGKTNGGIFKEVCRRLRMEGWRLG